MVFAEIPSDVAYHLSLLYVLCLILGIAIAYLLISQRDK